MVSVIDDLPGFQCDNAVTKFGGKFNLMQGNNDGDAIALIKLAQQFHNFARRNRIKGSYRLIGENGLRPLHKRARNRPPLLLSARQCIGALGGMITDPHPC